MWAALEQLNQRYDHVLQIVELLIGSFLQDGIQRPHFTKAAVLTPLQFVSAFCHCPVLSYQFSIFRPQFIIAIYGKYLCLHKATLPLPEAKLPDRLLNTELWQYNFILKIKRTLNEYLMLVRFSLLWWYG